MKYYNELEYEIERNSKIIEKRDDLLYDISRHIRDDINENEINKNVLERDVKRLNNLNKEYLDEINNLNKKYFKIYIYKKDIDKLENNLNNEKYARKELEKLYENFENDNKSLSEYVEKI